MDKLPITLFANVCQYLYDVDLLSLLELNRDFSLLWKNYEFWELLIGKRRSFTAMIYKELWDEMYDLRSLGLLYKIDEDNKKSEILKNEGKFINSDNKLTSGCMNLILHSIFNLQIKLLNTEYFHLLWRNLMNRRLQYLSYRHLLCLFQDVAPILIQRRVKSDLTRGTTKEETDFIPDTLVNSKVVAIYSPLIATCTDKFLNIYELIDNDKKSTLEFQNGQHSLEPMTSLKLRSKIPYKDHLYINETSFQLNLEIYRTDILKAKDYHLGYRKDDKSYLPSKVIRWMFYDNKLIIFITVNYGIYVYDIKNPTISYVLKDSKSSTAKFDLASQVICYDLSGDSLVVGLADGHLEFWEITKNKQFKSDISSNINIENSKNLKTLQINPLNISLKHIINYEHSYTQKIWIEYSDDWTAPLQFIHCCRKCKLAVAIYNGIVRQVRIFNLKKKGNLQVGSFVQKISLCSDIQACIIEPFGRFVVCVDSINENPPYTRLYSIKNGQLIAEFNYRILSPKFTPCGYFMLGINKRTSGSVLNSANSSCNLKKESNSTSSLSIWSIPSFRRIISLQGYSKGKFVDMFFSRARNSTMLVTVSVSAPYYEDHDNKPLLLTDSHVLFISHDWFAKKKPIEINYISSYKSGYLYDIQLSRLHSFTKRNSIQSQMLQISYLTSNKFIQHLVDLFLAKHTQIISNLFTKGFFPQILYLSSFASTEIQHTDLDISQDNEIYSKFINEFNFLTIVSQENEVSNLYSTDIEQWLLKEILNENLCNFKRPKDVYKYKQSIK
ncbi:uncharacterized protein CMU_029140 [Cryptosporidium muris RN66]|uniref:F-box domain-containing protein n=1 Tax=Cryptosporidium muris (strain RN66) TaxID=441375 RepID=B6AHZ9_CRYMR|nr:uncharacterized protein CMU_029140 [Cryptosporidium muris RN66]EEA07840.1 hypothetical protein, conserved [Cryptosporidium muris RN66]|eukprot:XP_002142189.1 hypothetical protein [Cryptosporidium muris RN66]